MLLLCLGHPCWSGIGLHLIPSYMHVYVIWKALSNQHRSNWVCYYTVFRVIEMIPHNIHSILQLVSSYLHYQQISINSETWLCGHIYEWISYSDWWTPENCVHQSQLMVWANSQYPYSFKGLFQPHLLKLYAPNRQSTSWKIHICWASIWRLLLFTFQILLSIWWYALWVSLKRW